MLLSDKRAQTSDLYQPGAASVNTDIGWTWYVLTSRRCKALQWQSSPSLLWQLQMWIHTNQTANRTTQQWWRSSGAQPRSRWAVSIHVCRHGFFLSLSLFTHSVVFNNVTFNCCAVLFRGAVFGAHQGNRSRRHASCFTARVRAGSTESGADDTAVGKKLRRWGNQVRRWRNVWLRRAIQGHYYDRCVFQGLPVCHVCVAVYLWWWRMSHHPVASQWKCFPSWLWLHSSNRSENCWLQQLEM